MLSLKNIQLIRDKSKHIPNNLTDRSISMLITFSDIISQSSSEDRFIQVFKNIYSEQEKLLIEAHRTMLLACYRNPDLAPKITGKSIKSVATSWLKKYSHGLKSRISQRISKPPGTVPDPIVDIIISTRLSEISIEQVKQIKYAHRLSMSAENILGLLLEEFLSEHLSRYGWHCCWGEVVRYVDFCNVDGSLLQVKNRSNSENSSSSKVRKNLPIEKWHRIDAETGSDRWSYFNEIYGTDSFSEQSFINFVRRVLTENPQALALDSDNPWKSRSE